VITPSDAEQQVNPVSLENQVANFQRLRCPPCYLILSDGGSTAVIERDLDTAEVRSDKEFIIITNNDTRSFDPDNPQQSRSKKEKSSLVLDMDSWIEESEERRACVWRKWSSVKRRQEKKLLKKEGASQEDVASMGWASVRENTLKDWLRAYPVMNECTHFMCIMDAQQGTVRFLERGVVLDDDIEEVSDK
tara:strand:- start:1154 stop:1726 length:573 start_codon:yes stop_codon:yes gene_type:complete